MSVFRFKQFEVKQSGSAMKVGTDSVLLGCFAKHQQVSSILDIGTGTGLLALMMAQRFRGSRIDAVEVDDMAYEEAKLNIQRSSWSAEINVYHNTFQQFATTHTKQYDLIISNPPYYIGNGNTKIEDRQRSRARHGHELPFEDLLNGCSVVMKETGTCWFILPVQEAEIFGSLATKSGLFLHYRILISPKPEKGANRVIMGFGKMLHETEEHSMTIYTEQGKYTHAYFELTKEFLLWEKGL